MRRLFEPLGYAVDVETASSVRRATSSLAPARRRCGSRDLLTHLYVLLPVLDDEKHYWVDDDRDREAAAPRRGLAARRTRSATLITRRYLKHERRL